MALNMKNWAQRRIVSEDGSWTSEPLYKQDDAYKRWRNLPKHFKGRLEVWGGSLKSGKYVTEATR